MLLLLPVLCTGISAQQVSVLETKKLTDAQKDGTFYFPKMSPAGDRVYFTGENFRGISYYDMGSGQILQVTDQPGAGYNFSVSKDGSAIVYRTSREGADGQARRQQIIEKNIQSNEEIIIAEGDNLTTPLSVSENAVTYAHENNFQVASASAELSQRPAVPAGPVVNSGDDCMMLYINGQTKKLAPLGAGSYIWTSVSPDGTRLLFTVAGKGTYISDLQGKILTELGYANAPVWSPDGKYIAYMVDKDNGTNYTSSDIYVVSSSGENRQKLTDTANIIEMYPQWGDSSHLLFHSDDGSIYSMKLKID